MLFNVINEGRSTVTTDLNEFAVFGDLVRANVAEATPSVIFHNTEVIRNNGVWGYKNATQYWFPEYEYSFVAIHPISMLQATDVPQYEKSGLTFSYSLPTADGTLVNESEVIDIVSATHRRLYNEGDADNVVSLRFGHLFTLVNFSLELTDPSSRSEEFVKIHKLEISGFGTSATIHITPAQRQSNNQTNDSEIDVVTAKGNGSMKINFDEPIEVINGATAVKMFDSNNAIIMLPQTFEGNDKVQISLTYTANDEAEETQVSANLSNFKWESGRSYNYQIKLEVEQKDVNIVISEATIAPWNLVDDHDQVDAR